MNIFSREIFAGRLKCLRTEKGLTQSTLGDAIGLTKQTINDLEHRRATTTIEKLYAIAKYFNVSADYLIGLTDESDSHKETH